MGASLRPKFQIKPQVSLGSKVRLSAEIPMIDKSCTLPEATIIEAHATPLPQVKLDHQDNGSMLKVKVIG